MIYLDHGATSWPKPETVRRSVLRALETCGNPGRGGYGLSMEGARTVYEARRAAARLFHCTEDQVAFTTSCTHGLNMAIRTLVSPGDRVVVSGFEHNAVIRTLHALKADLCAAGRKLFSWEDTLEHFEDELRKGAKAAVFTHVSNVFGYVLPAGDMAYLCRKYRVPFILDAAQSAGHMPLDFGELGADFIAMPGHKGLLGPMGTGLLLCGRLPDPVFFGGTGSQSIQQEMPDFLPDRAEAGTVNVPGIAGLRAGLDLVRQMDPKKIGEREANLSCMAANAMENLGIRVFHGPHQGGTLSFLPPDGDCETMAEKLGCRGICVRAGVHCAPLAHESAGTLQTGTVRVSFGFDSGCRDVRMLCNALREICRVK